MLYNAHRLHNSQKKKQKNWNFSLDFISINIFRSCDCKCKSKLTSSFTFLACVHIFFVPSFHFFVTLRQRLSKLCALYVCVFCSFYVCLYHRLIIFGKIYYFPHFFSLLYLRLLSFLPWRFFLCVFDFCPVLSVQSSDRCVSRIVNTHKVNDQKEIKEKKQKVVQHEIHRRHFVCDIKSIFKLISFSFPSINNNFIFLSFLSTFLCFFLLFSFFIAFKWNKI